MRVRGHSENLAPGLGPISVATAREMLGESVLKLVLTDGVAVRNVTHLGRGPTVAQKVALLCLHDVEYRILHYLSTLPATFHTSNTQEYSIPLSQSELAHLIGATRETTSTTLNNLARRGLVKLGRRMLLVTSMDAVRNAAHERSGATPDVDHGRTAGRLGRLGRLGCPGRH